MSQAVPAHSILLREADEEPRPRRRHFLKTLATAPIAALATHKLIMPGGGVPAAINEPPSRDLLFAYGQWLKMELRVLSYDLFPDQPYERKLFEFYSTNGNPGVEDFHTPPAPLTWRTVPQPSSRAALVLDTVGCDWRRT